MIRLHSVAGDGVLGRYGDLIVLCSAPADRLEAVDAVLAAHAQVAQAGGDGTALADRLAQVASGSGLDIVAFAPAAGSLVVSVFGTAWAILTSEYGEQRLAPKQAVNGVRSVLPGSVLAIRAGLGDVDTDSPVQRWSDLGMGTVRASGLLLAVADELPASAVPLVDAPATEAPAVDAPVLGAPAARPMPSAATIAMPPPEPLAPPRTTEPMSEPIAETLPVPEPTPEPEPVPAPMPEPVPAPMPESVLPPPPEPMPEPVMPPAPPEPLLPPPPEPMPEPVLPPPPEPMPEPVLPPAPPEPLLPPPPEPMPEPVLPPPPPPPPAPAGPPVMAAVSSPDIAVDRSSPFSSVSLFTPSAQPPEPDREPLPIATRPAEPVVPEADALPAHPVPDDVAEIMGVYCKNGHFDDPAARYCAICGISMAQQTLIQRRGPRPPLGVLVLDDGSIFSLDTDYVIGRDPSRDADVVAGTARPLRIDDPEGLLSRVHARIHLDGWTVEVVDLGSANGTGVWGPTDSVWQRAPAQTPIAIRPGTQVGVGRRQMRYESHRNT